MHTVFALDRSDSLFGVYQQKFCISFSFPLFVQQMQVFLQIRVSWDVHAMPIDKYCSGV